MTTPCQVDPGQFIDTDNKSDMTYATKLCKTVCPVRDECLELGRGERYGVWGGELPWAPQRAAYRKLFGDGDGTRTHCRNGHPRTVYRIEGRDPLGILGDGCRRCTELQLALDNAIFERTG